MAVAPQYALLEFIDALRIISPRSTDASKIRDMYELLIELLSLSRRVRAHEADNGLLDEEGDYCQDVHRHLA